MFINPCPTWNSKRDKNVSMRQRRDHSLERHALCWKARAVATEPKKFKLSTREIFEHDSKSTVHLVSLAEMLVNLGISHMYCVEGDNVDTCSSWI